MPTVPQAKREVQQTPLRGVQQQGASRAAFGSGVGEALSQLGSVIGKHELDELALQNETRAKELDVEFSQSLRAMQFDPQQGYYNKRGKDAYDYQPIFHQATTELSKQFLEKAENDSQRMMLSKVMQQRVSRAKDGVARHAFKEYNAWVDGASIARADDALQEAIVNHSDKDLVRQLRVSGRAEIQTTGQRQGKDQEAINADLKDFDSKIHVGTVDTLIQQNVKQARIYFEENKEEIDGREHSKVLRRLKVAEKGDLATDREHYAQLSRMSAFDVDSFIKVDLAEYELSDADFKKFENAKVQAQRSKSRHDEKQSGIKRSMSLANTTLKSAGIKTTGKLTKKQSKLLNSFQGALLLEIEYFNNENGRAPDDKEQLNMIGNLLKRGDVAGTGIFFEDEAFLFEGEPQTIIQINDIDVNEQAKIREAYKRKLGRDPTTKEIERVYTKSILSRTHGGQ